MNKQGINPVTFKGQLVSELEINLQGNVTRLGEEKINLSISRLGLGYGRDSEYKVKMGQQRVKEGEEEFNFFVTIVMWKEGTDGKPEILGHTVLDQAHFTKGLGHLFPHGELANVHLEE